jgi:hypothetical protein
VEAAGSASSAYSTMAGPITTIRLSFHLAGHLRSRTTRASHPHPHPLILRSQQSGADHHSSRRLRANAALCHGLPARSYRHRAWGLPVEAGPLVIEVLSLNARHHVPSAVDIHVRGLRPTGKGGETYRPPVSGDALGLVGAVL